MKYQKIMIMGCVIIVVLLSSAFYFQYMNPMYRFEGVEITEYEGQNLSSINAFRENSITGPQYIDNASYRLTISGLVTNPFELTYDQVITQHPLYQKVVTLHCVEGWDVTILWEGVLVADLLTATQSDAGATTVIFYAADGYSTSLPLTYILQQNILMAYKMNGVILPPERGFPFQLVAESKWGYKWIKWITRIDVTNDSNYRGYWESRGYSNNATIP